MTILEPSKDNVKLRDLLIVSPNDNPDCLTAVPITKINEKYITATNDNRFYYAMLYKEALVLKKDKSLFLIGREVPDYFKKSPLRLK